MLVKGNTNLDESKFTLDYFCQKYYNLQQF